MTHRRKDNGSYLVGVIMIAAFTLCASHVVFASGDDDCAQNSNENGASCMGKQLTRLKTKLQEINRSWAKKHDRALIESWNAVWLEDIRKKCNTMECLLDNYKLRLADLQKPCDALKAISDLPRQDSSVEVALGKLCAKEGEGCASAESFKGTGVPIERLSQDPAIMELTESGAAVHLSRIDVDNDSTDEIRALAVVGSARCARSYFFKGRQDGSYETMSNKGFEMFTEEGRFCGKDVGSFIRYHGFNYFVESMERGHDLFIGLPSGLYLTCSVDERSRKGHSYN